MIEISVLLLYNLALLLLFAYNLGQLSLIVQYVRTQPKQRAARVPMAVITDPELPTVTVQLPVYNELYVVERLLDAVLALRYPADKLTIQVLDDSTDETTALIAHKLTDYQQRGIHITHLRRPARTGYKAGALAHGLTTAPGELIAIFDADFMPEPDFLLCTVPHFAQPRIGMVQTRWTHLNAPYSLLTRVQGFGLDVHFLVEQNARSGAGLLLNFNGTAGIWRKTTILDAGGWQADTLTEDLDLSYRAQLQHPSDRQVSDHWQFIYREDICSPAELPVSMNAFKAQQYRWMKGGAETARKLLWPLLTAPGLTGWQKMHGFFHLISSTMFALIWLLAVLSVPVLVVQHRHPVWWVGLGLIDLLQVNVLISLVFYGISFWKQQADGFKISTLLLFLGYSVAYVALMLGVSLHNSLAVAEGWAGHRTPFVRTPKFNVALADGSWRSSVYLAPGFGGATVPEGLSVLYFLFGIGLGLYWHDYRMLFLHGLLTLGFGGVFGYSLLHATRLLTKTRPL